MTHPAQWACSNMQMNPPGQPASLHLVFGDNKEETLDITNMHSGQVSQFIESRVQERDMAEVLTTHNFAGKKLHTKWGL